VKVFNPKCPKANNAPSCLLHEPLLPPGPRARVAAERMRGPISKEFLKAVAGAFFVPRSPVQGLQIPAKPIFGTRVTRGR
jgi:hypothetical protein